MIAVIKGNIPKNMMPITASHAINGWNQNATIQNANIVRIVQNVLSTNLTDKTLNI